MDGSRGASVATAEGRTGRTRGPLDRLSHESCACFPAYKDLSGFDFAASEINEATVRTLHRCEFMDGAQNIVLIGGPGTGKTQVALVLGQLIMEVLWGMG